MSQAQQLYRDKLCSPQDALRLLRDGDTIIVPTGAGEPPSLLTALSEQRRSFHDIKVAQILAMRKFGYFDQDTSRHVRHAALFFGGASRASGQGGWCDFIPNYFSEIPVLIERGLKIGRFLLVLGHFHSNDCLLALSCAAAMSPVS